MPYALALVCLLLVACGGDNVTNNEWPHGDFGSLSGSIVYSSNGTLYRLNLEEVTVEELFPGTDIAATPDGGMVYITEEGLMISDSPTSEGTLLVARGTDPNAQFQYRRDFHDPVVSPDADWIAYQESTSGATRVHVVSSSSGDLVTSFIDDVPAGYQFPFWLGNQIVIAGIPGVNDGLWTSFSPEFSTLTGFDGDFEGGREMVVSHNLQYILYMQDGDLHRFNRFSETSEKISETSAVETAPAWSPDDEWVVVHSGRDLALIEIGGDGFYSVKEILGPLAPDAADTRVAWFE